MYIKKVYESIRESIPRYIGQGLLRKVARYFKDHAFNNLLEVVKEVPFAIQLTQPEIHEIKNK